jgi:hypothetical protein
MLSSTGWTRKGRLVAAAVHTCDKKAEAAMLIGAVQRWTGGARDVCIQAITYSEVLWKHTCMYACMRKLSYVGPGMSAFMP